MKITEVKKIVKNLQSLIRQHDECSILLRFHRKPENEGMMDVETLLRIEKRIKTIESAIEQILK